MTGWQALANAIVEQAAKDYRADIRLVKKNPDAKAALKDALEIEKFFHSGWYSMLTDVDGDYLIKRLRREAMK